MDELGEIRAALMDAVIKIDALRDAAEYTKKFDAFNERASRGVGRGERDIGKAWEKSMDDYTAKVNETGRASDTKKYESYLSDLANRETCPDKYAAIGKAMRDAVEANAPKTPLIFKTEDEARAYNKGVADGHSGVQVPGIAAWYYK